MIPLHGGTRSVPSTPRLVGGSRRPPARGRDAAAGRTFAMPTTSLTLDGHSTIVARFTAEFENPTRASRRATHAAEARAASGRRRLIDPTTCERDYSAAEMEFM